MELHTASRVPDWELVCVDDQNRWQQIAAQTQGIVTPANAVTLAGNLLTIGGVLALSRGKTLGGIAAIALGRAADIVDGRVAHATGTKSPLGEAFDAGFDKVQTAFALPVLMKTGNIPKKFGYVLGAQQAAISGFSIVAKYQKHDIHPTMEGKLATAANWTSLISFALAKNTSDKTSATFDAFARASAIACLTLSAIAIPDYAIAALSATSFDNSK
jgi:phosphatidylglycerophosphate synthase